MKKITFIRAVDSKHGGAENFLTRLMTELKNQGVDCTVKHSSIPKWLPSWIRAWRFNAQVRHQKGSQFYFSLDRIDSADIYRAGDGVHRSYMKTRKTSSNPLHWTYCTLEKRCFNNAKKIIANCLRVKQEIIDEYGISADKISVIYNGINIPKINRKAARDAIDQEFPQAKNKPIILMAGSGFERKGVKAFLQQIAKLNTSFHAFIVGKEKHPEPYYQLAQSLGLTDKVTFTGMRDDLNAFYQSARLFLFMPSYEPFGNVVLEALANQTPALTNHTCGAHEILPAPFQIQPNEDKTALIEQLLSDDAFWQQSSDQAFEIAKAHPISKTTAETLAVIKEVME